MGKVGRPKGSGKMVRLGDQHREKIANSQILNRLLAHFNGTVTLSKSQVDVGLSLLRKVLPDLANHQIEHTVDGQVTFQVVTGVPRSPLLDNQSPMIENNSPLTIDNMSDAEYEEIDSQIDDWKSDN